MGTDQKAAGAGSIALARQERFTSVDYLSVRESVIAPAAAYVCWWRDDAMRTLTVG